MTMTDDDGGGGDDNDGDGGDDNDDDELFCSYFLIECVDINECFELEDPCKEGQVVKRTKNKQARASSKMRKLKS